jgi:diphosphomevalonate decarboxylase
MQETVRTSELLQHRVKQVPGRMENMQKAIMDKDFEAFGHLTMMDSNQFHAVCLDTYPPIFYLNETSHRIINAVHKINAEMKRTVAAYTFDAGPNAVLYLLEQDLEQVLHTFLQLFMPASANKQEFITDPLKLCPVDDFKVLDDSDVDSTQAQHRFVPQLGKRPESHSVTRVIVSKIGDGARIIDTQNGFAQ